MSDLREFPGNSTNALICLRKLSNRAKKGIARQDLEFFFSSPASASVYWERTTDLDGADAGGRVAGGHAGPRARAVLLAAPVPGACAQLRRTLQGSFSAVSKPNFASKYAFESSRRDLHNALLRTVRKAYFLFKNREKVAIFC